MKDLKEGDVFYFECDMEYGIFMGIGRDYLKFYSLSHGDVFYIDPEELGPAKKLN